MEVKWIKIVTNIFDNRKIKQIEKLPEGDGIIVIWFKLLVLAGCINDGGAIYFSEEIPYTEEMLAIEFNRPVQTVRLALKVFERYKMIKVIDDVLYISSWEKYQNTEALERMRRQTRERVAKHRANKRLLECNVTVTHDVTQCNATDIDIDKDIDKEPPKPPTGDMQVRFDEFWKAYPKKVGKAAAKKAYTRIKPTKELHAKMLAAIETAKRSDQWTKDNGQFIPHPTTWLNQGRWDDELEVTPKGGYKYFD